MAQVSERTQEYAFREQFGISPRQYLLHLRLNGVRKTLRVTDPAHESATAIATPWDFWHMGQFSKEDKQLFGELPSETLKKDVVRASLEKYVNSISHQQLISLTSDFLQETFSLIPKKDGLMKYRVCEGPVQPIFFNWFQKEKEPQEPNGS